MDNNKYKIDRTFTSQSSFAQADNHVQHWENKTLIERLNAACFIINNIFGTTPQTKVDRTVITQRKHSNA